MKLKTLLYKFTHSPATWHYLDYEPDIKLDCAQAAAPSIIYRQQQCIVTRPLAELSQLFTGQTVFLIGTGPSLKEQAIECLQGKKLLFLNGALTLSQSAGLQATALMIVDKGFIQRHPQFLPLIPLQTPCLFTLGVVRQLLNQDIHFFEHRPLYLLEKASKPYDQAAKKIHQLDPKVFIRKENSVFSTDISKGFAEAGTVMYVAAQLMYYYQVAHMTLVGFDLGNADQPRFYETKANQDKSGLQKALYQRIIPAFSLLAEMCKQKNIDISNASHLSQMPYSIIPFNDYLKRA